MDAPNRPSDSSTTPDPAGEAARPGAPDDPSLPQLLDDAPPVPGANPPRESPEPASPEETPPSPS